MAAKTRVLRGALALMASAGRSGGYSGSYASSGSSYSSVSPASTYRDAGAAPSASSDRSFQNQQQTQRINSLFDSAIKSTSQPKRY